MFKSRVEINDSYGRTLITTDVVHKSEVIVEETAFAFGPIPNTGIVCLGCYKDLPFEVIGNEAAGWKANVLDRCSHCTWPLCKNCSDVQGHREECQIFAANQAKFTAILTECGICLQLNCITPLRVLLAKESNPERWTNEVEPMEYHDEERRQYEEIWHADLVNVAQYLRGPCKLADRFSEELIMRVIGILEVNAFEARTLEGYPLRCLYPTTGVLAHNCVPNTTGSIYPSENYIIRLRAMIDLEPGQQLHHCYTYTLDGTNQRQEHLKAGKYFNCMCNRCKDPTELGTNLSTFKCSKCDDGWLLWDNPLDANTMWKCTKCEFKLSNNVIRTAVAVMQGEVENLQNMEWSAERLQEAERLLSKYDCVVHPLHFIQTSLRLSLVHMYGHVQGYEINELPIELLKRKEELCRQLLQVLSILEPGISRTRAMLLYELYTPIVLLAKDAYNSGAITSDGLKEKILQTIEMLRECADILKFEDAQTQEGILGFMAKQAIQQLTNSINDIAIENNSTTL